MVNAAVNTGVEAALRLGLAPPHLGVPLWRSAALIGLAISSSCIDTGVTARGTQATEPVTIEETFTQSPQPKIDVLWVVDSTCSMSEEQLALGDAFGAFADALDNLDLSWQAGVITTDISGVDAGVLQGNPWVIHPGLEDPAQAFAQAAAVGTDPLATQAGLGAAWLALSAPLINVENLGFRRPDASLHVVVLSDGDDDSSSVLGDDPATAFLAFLDEQAATTGLGAQLSAVVGDVPDGCSSAQPGTIYVDVAEQSGGAVASICSASFDTVADTIGQASIEWPDTFMLQAQPAADSVDAWVNDVRAADDDFAVNLSAPSISFLTAPGAGATIRVRYVLSDQTSADTANTTNSASTGS